MLKIQPRGSTQLRCVDTSFRAGYQHQDRLEPLGSNDLKDNLVHRGTFEKNESG